MNPWMILFLACCLEAAFGYPRWLYARIRHPVVWMGACITGLERHFNPPPYNAPGRKAAGALAVALLLAATLACALGVQALGAVAEMLAMASLLAGRSLFDHARAVHTALTREGLEAGRASVGRIVGRDVSGLDEAGVCRAGIESLAESLGDAVAAPMFWAACFGLPGIACYKALNTADSMIGHKDARHRAFGWAAARLDDGANFLPARGCALLLVIAAALTPSASGAGAWRCLWRDARRHASPNAGWPEAAMAGALGLRLGGPNLYDGQPHAGAFLGDGTPSATPAHLARALRLYVSAASALMLLLVPPMLAAAR